MDSYETGNSKQMNHKQRYLYACVLASRRVSVVALCFIMKLDEIVRWMMDGDYTCVSVLYSIHTCTFASIEMRLVYTMSHVLLTFFQLNCAGVTVECGQSYMHFTSHQHTLAPVPIGAHAYTRQVSFVFDVHQYMQEYFNHAILVLFASTFSGSIQPRSQAPSSFPSLVVYAWGEAGNKA